MSIKTILMIFVMFSIFYWVHYFILKTIRGIFDKEMSFRCYAFPFFITIALSFFTQISYLISLKIYSIIYFISTSYLGLVVNMLLTSFVYKIITLIFGPVNFYFGIFITIVSPSLIVIYGLIHARTITIAKNISISPNNKYKGISRTKIAHLSDLHLGAIYQTKFIREIVEIIKTKINPDIVVITGDLVDSSMKPLDEWFEPFKEITVPILYITGNHEEMIGRKIVLNTINKFNFNHIGTKDNYLYEFNGIKFVGVDYEFDVVKRLQTINPDKEKYNVLLSHVPNLYPKDLEKFNINLFLCGHAHGGQMFPMHITSYLSSKCFKGLYNYLDRFVYVSQGLGTAIFPIRTGSSSCIGVITIEDTIK